MLNFEGLGIWFGFGNLGRQLGLIFIEMEWDWWVIVVVVFVIVK